MGSIHYWGNPYLNSITILLNTLLIFHHYNVFGVQDAEIEETRKTLATQKKEPLGAMLSTLLMKYYAKKDDELSTTLSFCLWPQYLRHYCKHSFKCNA